ncbi:MAG TPA: hypothetical protein VH763_02330 [Gemmatimonadales bacterium]
MKGKTMFRCLAVAASLMVVACSDTGNLTEPSDNQSPDLGIVGENARARHEALVAQLEADKAYFKAQRNNNREAFRAAKAEWKAWKNDWMQQRKLATEAWKRDHPGQKGGPEVQLLRCEPQDYSADAAIIGPNGGSLHVGQHQLLIPKGALDHEELIVAESPTSSLVDVRFAPHGLQFQKSAELKLSYKGCVLPTNSDFFVAYLGQGNQVLELPPSHDRKLDGEVEADIDHFSRYAIAW